MSVWTLKIGTITRTLAGWGIDAGSLQPKFNSFAPDTLTWAMTVADVLAEPAFNYNDAVTLYRDGVKWFVGRIFDDPVEFSAKGEVQKYVCKNAWADLETCIWKQTVTESSEDLTDLQTLFLSRVRLGWRHGTGKIDTPSQLEDVLDYAIADGIAIAYVVDFEGLTPPYQTVRDVSVATIARLMGKWTPDLASHFDYTTEPYPTVIFRRRGNPITPVELALDEYLPATGLVEARPIRQLYELFLDGVEVNFVASEPDPVSGDPFTAVRQKWAGVVEQRRRVVRITLDAMGRGTADEEPEPEDFAEAFLAIMQEKFYEARLTFRHQEVPGTYRPGMIINFTGGRAAWTTAKAIVQSVTETPFIGETVVECGAPPFLNKGNFAELARIVAGVDNYGQLAMAHIPSAGALQEVASSIACESKAKDVIMYGHSAYVSPEVPPRKWLLETESSQRDTSCAGTPTSQSGEVTKLYDAVTGDLVTAGAGAQMCAGFNLGIVYTPTTWVGNGNVVGGSGGGTCNCASGQVPFDGTWSQSNALSEENTEENALNAQTESDEWQSLPSGCINHTAFRTLRGAGEFTFTGRKGRSRVSFSSIEGRSYRVNTYFKRRVYGSGASFAPYVEVTDQITASGSSTVMPYVDTPDPGAGFEVLAASSKVYLLPET